MQKILQQLQADYPHLTFLPGDVFHWSPARQEITYATHLKEGIYSLFHELGHAILRHSSYATDAELLQKELSAWVSARTVAAQYGITIDEEFIEHCLDSYRDWIYKRSLCPSCASQGIQATSERYTCLNCHKTWIVKDNRLCRPYRRQVEK